jgi:hypothetical protein
MSVTNTRVLINLTKDILRYCQLNHRIRIKRIRRSGVISAINCPQQSIQILGSIDMTFETEGSHRNIDQGTRLTGWHDHKRLTASTYFIDTAVEFHFVGEIHCWPLYANVRVVAPVVGCSLVLAGNVRAVWLDQWWTAVCFQNECCVLSAYT